MAIQCQFFSVPLNDVTDVEAALNGFLSTVRQIHTHKEIVHQHGRSYWAVAVEYFTGEAAMPHKNSTAGKRFDYKDELSPEDFTDFAKLRDWRKTIAAKEAVQLYTVFTNEQLATMVEKRVMSKTGFGK